MVNHLCRTARGIHNSMDFSHASFAHLLSVPWTVYIKISRKIIVVEMRSNASRRCDRDAADTFGIRLDAFLRGRLNIIGLTFIFYPYRIINGFSIASTSPSSV